MEKAFAAVLHAWGRREDDRDRTQDTRDRDDVERGQRIAREWIEGDVTDPSVVPVHHAQLCDALHLEEVVAKHLDRTHTSAGASTLRHYLHHPLENASSVRARQDAIAELSDDATCLASTRASLKKLEAHWQALCWCWDDGEAKQEVVGHVLFRDMFDRLNDVPLVHRFYHSFKVLGAPLMHLVSPLVPVVLAYFVLRWTGGVNISFAQCWRLNTEMFRNMLWGEARSMRWLTVLRAIWATIFVVSAIMLIHAAYRHLQLLRFVHTRVVSACRWVSHAVKLAHTFGLRSAGRSACLDALEHFSDHYSSAFHCFSSAYPFVHAYRLLRSAECRTLCRELAQHVGTIDARQSICTLLQPHASGATPSYVLAEISARPTAFVKLEQATFPLLDGDEEGETRSRPADIRLKRNTILTGGNGAGKSTVLRMVGLNVLMAQSLGVARARRMRWTPFQVMRGYLHTPDRCAVRRSRHNDDANPSDRTEHATDDGMSLFQTQVRRIEDYILATRAMRHDPLVAATTPATPRAPPLALLLVDEILTSTNPVEGATLSHVYAEQLARCDGSLALITTHFPTLAQPALRRGGKRQAADCFARWQVQQHTHALSTGVFVGPSAIALLHRESRVLERDVLERAEHEYHACLEEKRALSPPPSPPLSSS